MADLIMPIIDVSFREAASTFVARSSKGTIGVILFGTADADAQHIMYDENDIPSSLSEDNRAYLERIFIGAVNKPKKVIAYVLATGTTAYTNALNYFETIKIDYIIGDPEITSALSGALADWVEAERSNKHMVKAVLPSTASDSEAIVNFDTDGIYVGTDAVTTEEFVGRIAGLIAGTPITQSCTHAVLPEVTKVESKKRSELNAAITAGKFVLFNDGNKVKVARGITSMTTVDGKIEAFKKIKIVEAADMIQSDIRTAIEDGYIGKMANTYDNKCVLIAAIAKYCRGLEADGILQPGSTVGIDVSSQRAYLIAQGVDVTEMSEQQIKEANTDDNVYININCKILDAMENFTISVAV